MRNSKIKRGDAIIISYSGHGSQAVAPKGWVSDNNRIETVCPHDEQTIDSDGKEVFGIPDRTIGALLRRIAATKGDNIVRRPSPLSLAS